MKSVVLKGASVVTPRTAPNLSGDENIDCRGCYVVPGFRDQHIHDINGFMKHIDNLERFAKVSEALAAQGVTAYMSSLSRISRP